MSAVHPDIIERHLDLRDVRFDYVMPGSFLLSHGEGTVSLSFCVNGNMMEFRRSWRVNPDITSEADNAKQLRQQQLLLLGDLNATLAKSLDLI